MMDKSDDGHLCVGRPLLSQSHLARLSERPRTVQYHLTPIQTAGTWLSYSRARASEEQALMGSGGSANKANGNDKDDAPSMNVSVQRGGDPVDACMPSGPRTRRNMIR